LIEDSLDVSRIENGKFEINKGPHNIRQMINEVADIMEF
jgi:signal transduction histidine kinase